MVLSMVDLCDCWENGNEARALFRRGTWQLLYINKDNFDALHGSSRGNPI